MKSELNRYSSLKRLGESPGRGEARARARAKAHDCEQWAVAQQNSKGLEPPSVFFSSLFQNYLGKFSIGIT